jgi:hypothetical protein
VPLDAGTADILCLRWAASMDGTRLARLRLGGI